MIIENALAFQYLFWMFRVASGIHFSSIDDQFWNQINAGHKFSRTRLYSNRLKTVSEINPFSELIIKLMVVSPSSTIEKLKNCYFFVHPAFQSVLFLQMEVMSL